MNQISTKNEKAPRRRRTMDAPSTYRFEQAKREYIVEPVFKSEGEPSLFSLTSFRFPPPSWPRWTPPWAEKWPSI